MHNIHQFSISLAITIGFSQRRQFIPESAALLGDLITLRLDVHSSRISDIEYIILFQVLSMASSATVGPYNEFPSAHFDALFGWRENERTPITSIHTLEPGTLELIVETEVINDFVPEELECYVIRLSPDHRFSRDNYFMCSDDEVNETDFFCLHTVCIEDDDG